MTFKCFPVIVKQTSRSSLYFSTRQAPPIWHQRKASAAGSSFIRFVYSACWNLLESFFTPVTLLEVVESAGRRNDAGRNKYVCVKTQITLKFNRYLCQNKNKRTSLLLSQLIKSIFGSTACEINDLFCSPCGSLCEAT